MLLLSCSIYCFNILSSYRLILQMRRIKTSIKARPIAHLFSKLEWFLIFLAIAESDKFAAVSKTFLGLSKTIGGGWWCSPNPEWHLNPTNCSHTDTRSRNQALGEINQLAGSSTMSQFHHSAGNFRNQFGKLWTKFKRSYINHPKLSHMFIFQDVLFKCKCFFCKVVCCF